MLKLPRYFLFDVYLAQQVHENYPCSYQKIVELYLVQP